MRNVLTS